MGHFGGRGHLAGDRTQDEPFPKNAASAAAAFLSPARNPRRSARKTARRLRRGRARPDRRRRSRRSPAFPRPSGRLWAASAPGCRLSQGNNCFWLRLQLGQQIVGGAGAHRGEHHRRADRLRALGDAGVGHFQRRRRAHRAAEYAHVEPVIAQASQSAAPPAPKRRTAGCPPPFPPRKRGKVRRGLGGEPMIPASTKGHSVGAIGRRHALDRRRIDRRCSRHRPALRCWLAAPARSARPAPARRRAAKWRG